MLLRSGLDHVAIRLVTLVLRFALSFYVIGFLELREAGIYGLAVGAIGVAPALIGWGLNYHLSREIVGRSPAGAAPLVRDRMMISLGSLLALSAVAIPLAAWTTKSLDWDLYALIVVLVWLETLALDIFVALIALEKALLANLLVLVRSALWIPPLIALGLADARFRSLEWLFAAWIGFHLVAFGLFAWRLRGRNLAASLAQPVRADWAIRWVREKWFIYLSDLGSVALVYLDRYVVAVVLGMAATAVYTFYWTLANAVLTIIVTALVQVVRPRLIRAARKSRAEWEAEMRRQLLRTLTLALALAALIFGATEAIVGFLPQFAVPADRPLFLLILFATIVRCCSETLNAGLMSLERDRSYAAANLVGLAATLAVAPIAMQLWGLLGAGAALALVTAMLFVLRAFQIERSRRMFDADKRGGTETGF